MLRVVIRVASVTGEKGFLQNRRDGRAPRFTGDWEAASRPGCVRVPPIRKWSRRSKTARPARSGRWPTASRGVAANHLAVFYRQRQQELGWAVNAMRAA